MARADANILDANGDAPLHSAIKGGHVSIAEYLLISGADPSAEDSEGDYPIHLAAGRGQDEIVRSLVQRGVNLNLLDGKGQTPLAVAVVEDRVSTVEVLLAGNADGNIQMSEYRETVLHVAAEKNKAGSIPALVEAGANIATKNIAGATPLHYAVLFDSCAALLAPLQLGANVNAKSDIGWNTPLHQACSDGRADAADLLLRWGADETIVSAGKTPSDKIPDIAEADEQDRPRLERVTKLLANAPQDRAWRRRGFVVMCGTHPNRLRLVVEIPDNAAEATGQQRRERPSRCARTGQVKVEVGVGGAHGWGAGSGNTRRTWRRAGGEDAGGGFGGVAAWLMAVNDEDVFRNIVAFL